MKLDFGKAISIKDANLIMERHVLLNPFLIKEPDVTTPTSYELSMKEYKKRKFNTFVFDVEKIKGLIKDDLDAKYIVVLLGAHPKAEDMEGGLTEEEKEYFKEGGYTVLITACERFDEFSGTIKTVKLEKPVIEYPPSYMKFRASNKKKKSEDEVEQGIIEVLDSDRYIEYEKEIKNKFVN